MKKVPSTLTFKKPKLFRQGTLVFERSGHALVISDRYYRCIPSCKGKCNANGEKQIRKETLDRAFTRLAQKFALDEKTGKRILNQLMRDNLCDLLFGTMDNSDAEQEIIDSTRAVMLQEVVTKDKVHSSDIKDMDDALVKQQQAEYPIMLLGTTANLIAAFMNPHKEAMIGFNLALLCKRIYLNNKGKILKIELEKWGWYTLNFIEKQSPGYLKKLAEKKIIITNKPDEITNLSFSEAALSFGVGTAGEAMGQDATMLYGVFRIMRGSLGTLVDGDPDKMNKANALMYDYFQKNPSFALLTKMVASAGL